MTMSGSQRLGLAGMLLGSDYDWQCSVRIDGDLSGCTMTGKDSRGLIVTHYVP
jgi:hypothetical protein